MSQRTDIYRGLGSYGTLGMEIVVGLLVGLLGGQWLDARYDTAPWWTVAGIALFLVTSVRAVQRNLSVMRRVAEAEERAEGNPAPLYDTSAPKAPEEPWLHAPQPAPQPDDDDDAERRANSRGALP